MTVDRYTKLVVTVIAVCLCWIAFGGTSPMTPVAAQGGDQRVVVTGWLDADGVLHQMPSFATHAGARKLEPGTVGAAAGLPMWNLN